MLSLLESDYPQEVIENQINERLKKRLFKMWWEGGDYFDALELLRNINRVGVNLTFRVGTKPNPLTQTITFPSGEIVPLPVLFSPGRTIPAGTFIKFSK